MKKGGKKVCLLPVRRGDTNSKSNNLTAKSSRLTDPVVTQFSQNCISQTGFKDNNSRVVRFHVAGGQRREVSEKERVQGHVSGSSRRCVDVLAKGHSKEKSLFREIKKRYAESRGPAPPINDDFSSLITRRVRPPSNIGCIPQYLRQAIKTEVKIVNDILAGKLDPASEEPSFSFYDNHQQQQQQQQNANLSQDCTAAYSDSSSQNMSSCKRPHLEATITTKEGGIDNNAKQKKPQTTTSKNNKENVHPTLKFPYIPESNWIFQTPPNRKLNFDHIKTVAQCEENGGLQPAVLQTGRERTVVYEMSKKINVNLSNFDAKQNKVNIDRRVMMQVASVSHRREQTSTTEPAAMVTSDEAVERCKETRFVFPHLQESEQEVEMMQTSPAKFQFFQAADPYELENHFLGLTCRPKKAANNIPRALGLKRKRDIFDVDHQCGAGDGKHSNNAVSVSGGRDGGEFDSDFAFINNVAPSEESFTYEFTGGGAGGDGTTMTGYMFDFEGNKKDSFDFRLGGNPI